MVFWLFFDLAFFFFFFFFSFFTWQQAFSLRFFCHRELWAGLSLESPPPLQWAGTHWPRSPGVGGRGPESMGLEFAHFRVIILMQIVLRFSKEGLVSLILSNWLCREFTVLLDYRDCSFIITTCSFRNKPVMQTEKKKPHCSHQNPSETVCHFPALFLLSLSPPSVACFLLSVIVSISSYFNNYTNIKPQYQNYSWSSLLHFLRTVLSYKLELKTNRKQPPQNKN